MYLFIYLFFQVVSMLSDRDLAVNTLKLLLSAFKASVWATQVGKLKGDSATVPVHSCRASPCPSTGHQ